MPPFKTAASVIAILGFATSVAFAEEQHEQHHPAETPPAAAAAPATGVPTGMAGTGMPMMGAGTMTGQEGMGMQMMARHVEGRIAFLKAELKITDAQLPLWNAFAQAMRDNAAAMQGMQGGTMAMMNRAGSLPDKLATREKMFTAHLETIRKLKAEAEPLYAGLSAEQKKTADEIMVSPMGMMM
jgi:hypothetical protein